MTWNWYSLLLDQGELLALIDEQLKVERSLYEILPAPDQVFNALAATAIADVRVVILGQDPYPTPGHAHGLAFSILPGNPIAAGARNIIQELGSDIGAPHPGHFFLGSWASQGVLLLNCALTVRAHQAGSHKDIGWHSFTDTIIARVADYHQHVVFILWGKHAWSKERLIPARHTIIRSYHPSPYTASKGFFGSKPFSRANAALVKHDQAEIDWNLPSLSSLT